MAEVVIIGAGPAGLSAALNAAESGHHCTLVEASDVVGGMAGSFKVATQRVDFGSHRLHFALAENHRGRFEQLLGDDLQVRPRNGRIRLRGRWIGFPLRAWDLLTHVPPSFGLRVAADALTGPLRRARDISPRDTSPRDISPRDTSLRPCGGSSFDAVIRWRFGATVAQEFYGPYTRKLYGVEPSELDAELAHRRVSAAGAGDVLRRIVRAWAGGGQQFWYPRRGYGQLSEALATAAADAGVEVRLNTAAESIRLDAERISVRLATSETLNADAVLSTLPVMTLASIINPAPLPAVADALTRCRSRSMVLVYLVVDQDQYTPFDAHYFGEGDTSIARLSEPKNYRDGDDPAGQTVLCAEIPCWAGDEMWHTDAERAAALVVDDLERCGLPAVHLSEFTLRRLRSVYPVFERATMTERATVTEWLRSLTKHGLVSFGRQGLAALDNLHHMMDMGSEAAAVLAPGGNVDADRWLLSLDRFATHVVED